MSKYKRNNIKSCLSIQTIFNFSKKLHSITTRERTKKWAKRIHTFIKMSLSYWRWFSDISLGTVAAHPFIDPGFFFLPTHTQFFRGPPTPPAYWTGSLLGGFETPEGEPFYDADHSGLFCPPQEIRGETEQNVRKSHGANFKKLENTSGERRPEGIFRRKSR